jgi:hypothetical protein
MQFGSAAGTGAMCIGGDVGVVAARQRLDSSPWDVTSGRAVLHEKPAALLPCRAATPTTHRLGAPTGPQRP